MNRSVVDAFVSSAHRVLTTELGASVSLGEAFYEDDSYVVKGVAAVVGVTGRLRGMVLLGISLPTALSLVSQIVGQPFDHLDYMAQSGIAELGNVVAGRSVTVLAEAGYHCGITPPAVIVGSDAVIAMPNIPRMVIPLITSIGVVEMQLALKENGAS